MPTQQPSSSVRNQSPRQAHRRTGRRTGGCRSGRPGVPYIAAAWTDAGAWPLADALRTGAGLHRTGARRRGTPRAEVEQTDRRNAATTRRAQPGPRNTQYARIDHRTAAIGRFDPNRRGPRTIGRDGAARRTQRSNRPTAGAWPSAPKRARAGQRTGRANQPPEAWPLADMLGAGARIMRNRSGRRSAPQGGGRVDRPSGRVREGHRGRRAVRGTPARQPGDSAASGSPTPRPWAPQAPRPPVATPPLRSAVAGRPTPSRRKGGHGVGTGGALYAEVGGARGGVWANALGAVAGSAARVRSGLVDRPSEVAHRARAEPERATSASGDHESDQHTLCAVRRSGVERLPPAGAEAGAGRASSSVPPPYSSHQPLAGGRAMWRAVPGVWIDCPNVDRGLCTAGSGVWGTGAALADLWAVSKYRAVTGAGHRSGFRRRCGTAARWDAWCGTGGAGAFGWRG